MNIGKIKKTLSTVLIACVGIATVIGILMLFNVVGMTKTVGNIYLSLLTVVVAGILLLNSVEAIGRKNTFGLISLGCILVSAVMFLIVIWLSEVSDGFLKTTVVFSLASVLFNTIVANYILLGKRMLALQVAFYVVLAYAEVVIGAAIIGFEKLIEGGMLTVFILDLILLLATFLILKIKSKNLTVSAEKETHAFSVSKSDTGEEMITIPLKLYNEMQAVYEKSKKE